LAPLARRIAMVVLSGLVVAALALLVLGLAL
jgi:hypothetical protein